MTNYLKLPFQCYMVSAENAGQFLVAGSKVSPFDGILAFALCTAGTLELTKQDVHYTLNQCDTMFILPTETAVMQHISPDFSCLAVVAGYDFYIETVDGILDIPTQIALSQHPFLTLTQQQYQMIVPLMLSLYDRIATDDRSGLSTYQHRLLRKLIISMASTIAYELIHIFVSNMCDATAPSRVARLDQVVQRYIALVFQHFAEHREISFYANQMHLSAHYLSTLVKQRTGVNASAWVRDRVIGEAKRMLDNTTLSVKQIAARLNFPNQSFFGRYFKQHVGLSPAQYRGSATSKSAAATNGSKQ